MKNTKIATALVILIIVGILAAIVWGSKSKKETTFSSQDSQYEQETGNKREELVFYYGITCPHCKEVEKWMEENKIEEKIEIIKKEVYDNKTNAEELVKSAKSCGLDTSAIGVPFLYTPEGKCLIGTPDVENYLKAKAGLLEENQATESGGNK